MRKNRSSATGSLVLVMSMAAALAACQTEEPTLAEQVLLNGKILTVDSEFSIADSLAIEGERIDVARALVSVRSAVIFLHEPMQSRNSGSTARALDEGRIPERKKNRRVPL